MESFTRILVIDEETDTKDLFLQKFRRSVTEGVYQFYFVTSIDEAVEMLRKFEFDIAITDISVAGNDSVSLIERWRTEYPLMRSIVVSAYGDINTLRAVMRGGAHDFVIKPIDFSDLQLTVSKTATVVKNIRQADAAKKKLTAISKELDVSAQLQRSMLPGNSLKQGSFELWADTHPAAEVGGDFYDFFWLDENRLGIVMADVSGKNVSAAMFAIMAKTLIKSFATMYESPAVCLQRANVALCAENVAMMFVTAMYGIIDITKNEIVYSSAGHLPLAVVGSKGDARFLECDSGIALGIMDSIDMKDQVYQFTPGDTIMMYTDGVPEASDINGTEYDNDRFIEALKANCTANPKLLTEAIVRSVKDFVKDAPQSDDITTLCVKYRLRVTPNAS